jgi:hypothetical protein
MQKNIIDLNGKWIFKKDKLNVGEKQEWYRSELLGIEIEVPAAWQSYNEELYNYCGYAWYYKKINLAKENDKRYFIKFKAVDYQAELYCNGSYIASHSGGYTPFEVELSNKLATGENMIHLKVFDPEDNDEIPHGKQGSWYSRVSGIWQDVELLVLPEAFIKNVDYQSDLEKKKINFELSIDKKELLENPEIKFEIFSPANKSKIIKEKTFSLGDDLELQFEEIKSWSPELPTLYDYKISLKDGDKLIDQYNDYFAFRKIEIRGDKFYLNNQPLYIRGALDQAFWTHSRYKLDNKEQIKAEIRKVQALGFNLLRKHIKIADPDYLEAADRMGLLIWEEPPNYTRWSRESRALFKNEYREMIKRDKNHPSVIIWSIYNEEWGFEWSLAKDEEKQQWLAEFYDYAKKLDPTRPICDNSGWAHVKTDINDIHRYFAVPEDAQSWQDDLDNYVIGNPEKNYVKDSYHNNEIKVLSEFGMWGLPEPSKLKERYDKMPQWYNNSSKLFDEEFKVPITAEINFEKYQLDRIFSSLDDLALATQKRESEGMKYLIEEIRKRKEIGGYVVTELSDIEWETNGFLDFFREEKPNFDYDLSYNQEILISLNLKKRNLYSGEKLKIEPLIINDSLAEIEGELYYQIENEEEIKIAEIKAGGSSKLKLEEKLIEMPGVDQAQSRELKLKLYLNEKIQKPILDKAEIRLYPELKKSEDKRGEIELDLRVDNPGFRDNLVKRGYKLGAEAGTGKKSLIISDYFDQEIKEAVKKGASLLFLAEAGSEIEKKNNLNFSSQPAGESWDKAASFNFFAAADYPELPFNRINDWELASIYPEYYLKNISDLGTYQVKAGAFKAWLGDFILSLVEIEMGKGKVVVSTFKIIENYGSRVQADFLFESVVKDLAAGGQHD